MNIQLKVAFTAILGGQLLATTLVVFYGRQMTTAADEALHKRGTAIAISVINDCEYGLLVGNKSLLQPAVAKALSQSDVGSVVVFDERGKLMAAAGQVNAIAKNELGPALVARYRQTTVGNDVKY